MGIIRRAIALLLCLAIVLPMGACSGGETESGPTETGAPAVDPVESYLAAAQDFIGKEDYASAISVLEQAGSLSEDPRIGELLDRIEEMRAVPVDLVVNTEDFLQSGSVEIHSVTASLRYNGFVRYTVDYTASAGLSIRMEGGRLRHEFGVTTRGGRDILEYEIEAAAVREMKTDILVVFEGDGDSRFHLRLVTRWPDRNSGGVAVPFVMEERPGLDCQIYSLTVQAADEDILIYTIDCTRPYSNNVVDLTIGPVDGEGLYVDNISVDHWTYNLTVSRAAVEAAGDLQLCFTDVVTGKTCTAILPKSEYVLPEVGTVETVTAEQELSFVVHNMLNSGSFQIRSCRVELLSTGFARYTIDYTAEENVSLWVNGFISNVNKNFFAERTPAAEGTARFYISREDLRSSTQILCTLNAEAPRGYYEIAIPNNWVNYVSEGQSVEESIELPFRILQSQNEDTYSLEKVSLQRLNNGLVRFAFDYQSAANSSWELSAVGIEFHVNIAAGAQDGPQRITLDVDPQELEGNYGLNLFCAEGWIDIQLMVIIDISQVLEQMTTHQIAVNLIRPVPAEENGIDLNAISARLEAEAEAMTFTPAIDVQAAMAVDTSMIQLLEVSRSMIAPKAQDGVQPYTDCYFQPLPEDADLSDATALAYSLSFSDETVFPDAMPASFQPQSLLEWGKDPGLNVEILHQLGYTGKGAVIAYIDQPIHDHAAYENVDLHYTDNSGLQTSMHGPAVISLLAGEEIGTAPEAEVWYYSTASWEMDHARNAECLYRIIEQNKSLPEGQKITMVGFSDNIESGKKNTQALLDAIKACEEAGIMVWFCGEYVPAAFLPMSDKNSFDNVIPDGVYGNAVPDLVHVPAGSRTTATGELGEYIYWGSGGYSWTMPYVLGLYAIVTEIDPGLTQEDLRKLVVETAYKHDGMKIVDPIAFVSAALEGVGRTADAEELRSAAEANVSYTYAVMNQSQMTAQDIAAAENYLREISESRVLVVDSSNITSAQQLYTVLQADHIQRGGKVAGIQLFGNADLIPAFEVGYKVRMENAVDEMGTMLTDLFYGNFDNAAADLSKNYSVLDHFANGWQIRLIPQWKVVRLPLAKGEFAPFLEKYMAFAESAGLGRQTLVNFSNPIFANVAHLDDTGAFLNRLGTEFGIDLGQYRLYGNLLGTFPVSTQVLGGFTGENLTAENAAGVREFFINTHGQKTNVDMAWFEGGQEQRQSLMNVDTVNTVLGENPYYLDLWTCNNGEAMKGNFTTAALNGQAVGVFSTTHIISNNGVDNGASLEAMAESNFFWFYLYYLNTLSKGASRSDAFFEAQKAYGNALIVDSQHGIRSEGNYQFNLYNLFGYHNFGLIEPNPAFSSINSTIS